MAVHFSASLLALDLLHLADELARLEDAGVDELVFPVSDASDAPAFGCGMAPVRACAGAISPCVILRLSDPGRFGVTAAVDAGAETIVLPAEAPVHLHRALGRIRDEGLHTGLLVKPTTPLTKLDYLLDYADRVHMLVSEAWDDAQPALQTGFERVQILREYLRQKKLRTEIVVQGVPDARTAARLVESGADRIVIDERALPEDGRRAEAVVGFLRQTRGLFGAGV